MPRTLRRPALAVALALTAVLLPTTQAAAAVRPAPPAPATGTVLMQPPVPHVLPPGAFFVSPPPTSAEIGEQVGRQQALVDAQQAALDIANGRAGQALEAYTIAQRKAELADRVAKAEAARLAAAVVRTAEAKQRLGGYVGSLYRTGMGTRKMSMYTSLLDSQNPQQLFAGLSIAQRVGGNQGNALTVLSERQAEQAQASARAVSANKDSENAKKDAAQTKKIADIIVSQLKDQVAARTIALLRTQAAQAAAKQQEERRAALLARAELIARQRAAAPPAAIDGAFRARLTAACKGQDTQGYPNGMIPAEALCPLWGTAQQMLRADAAGAFNEMSKAYAQEFGAPICVTDSYRSYDEQVAVAAEKPTLAAQPGTSNHGWGVATDLCDGIQAFGSATHNWMQANSMIYGWYHPAWAEQGGSKPEAWHWEFAG